MARKSNLFVVSVLSGVVWGWISMAVNRATGIFQFEASFTRDLAAFSFGGMVFGAVCGGLLSVAWDYIPFKGALAKAVFTSTSLWIVLRLGGAALSTMDPSRYHVITAQTLQGLVLAVVLGVVMGLMWKRDIKAH